MRYKWHQRVSVICCLHLQSSILKMQAPGYSETLTSIHDSTWRNIPEDSNWRFGKPSCYNLRYSTRNKEVAQYTETLELRHIPEDNNRHIPQDNNRHIPEDNNSHIPEDNNSHIPEDNNRHLHSTDNVLSNTHHVSTCTKMPLMQYFLSFAAVWSGLSCLYIHGFISLSLNYIKQNSSR